MKTVEQQMDYHRDEIARLGIIVAAARSTFRNVTLQAALIVHHACALAELERDGLEP